VPGAADSKGRKTWLTGNGRTSQRLAGQVRHVNKEIAKVDAKVVANVIAKVTTKVTAKVTTKVILSILKLARRRNPVDNFAAQISPMQHKRSKANAVT